MASFVVSGMFSVKRDETKGDETGMTGRRNGHGTGSRHHARRASLGIAAAAQVAMVATMGAAPIALSGCGSTGGSNTNYVGATGPKGNSTTIHNLMTKHNSDYAKLYASTKSGESLPYMMGYDVSYNWGMTAVADEEVIAKAWEALTDISLIGPDPDAPSVEDGGIQFTFVWPDGTKLPFTFVTSEWYRGPDKQMYYVIESDVIANLMREAEAAAVPIESIEHPKAPAAADPSVTTGTNENDKIPDKETPTGKEENGTDDSR